MQKPVRKAVFPVAGLGTRILPATKAMPKEMLPVVDKPLIQYAIEEARAAGIEEFYFVTGRAKSAIEDHFDVAVELEAALPARARQCGVVRAPPDRRRALRGSPRRRSDGRRPALPQADDRCLPGDRRQ